MAAIDLDSAIVTIEKDIAREPHWKEHPHWGEDQRRESQTMLREIKDHVREVSQAASRPTLVKLTSEFTRSAKNGYENYWWFSSEGWWCAVRVGDSVERVIALLGMPDSAGDGKLRYRPRRAFAEWGLPANGWLIYLEHGKIKEIQQCANDQAANPGQPQRPPSADQPAADG